MTSSMPSLILLDCQQENVCSDRPLADDPTDMVVARIRRLLVTARNSGWRIAHSQFRSHAATASIGQAPNAPIDCLKPLSREPVYVRTALSAYSEPAFARFVSDGVGPCFLVGFSAPFSLLATVFDASAHGDRLCVIPEAVGSSPVGARSASTVRDVAFDLIDRLAQTVRWDDVFDSWVPPSDPVVFKKIGLAR